MISYQGYLTDSGGSPVNGNVDLTFSLYNALTAGRLLWQETWPAVRVTNGLFALDLGTLHPIPLAFDAPYYLGITVGADPEMTPRTALGSTPYAIRAGTAENVPEGAITDVMITGPIAASKIVQGPGSLFNADLLDGSHASAFMSAAADNWVNTTGDFMSGPLTLPANGLLVGTAQLVVNGGRVGIGTAAPTSMLTVAGPIASTSGGFKFPDGTVQTTTAAVGNIVVVDQAGTGFTNIQSAINAISPSATDPYVIEVRAGIYVENLTLKSHVHLKGAGRDATVLAPRTSGGRVIALPELTNVKISGFTFRAAADPERRERFWGVHDNGSSPRIFDCRFTRYASGGGGIECTNSAPEILHNEFVDTEGHAVFLRAARAAVIKDNLFDLNLGGGATVWLLDSSASIEQNTFLNNVTGPAIEVDGFHPDELVGRLTRISANQIQGDVVLDTQSVVIEGNDFVLSRIIVTRGQEALIVGNVIREGVGGIATIESHGACTAIVGNMVYGGILVDAVGQISGNTITPLSDLPAIEAAGYGARIANNTILGGSPGILAKGKTEIVGNYISPRTVAIDTSQASSSEHFIWGNRIEQDTPDTVGHQIVSPSAVRLESTTNSIVLKAGTNSLTLPTAGSTALSGGLLVTGPLDLTAGANRLLVPTSGYIDVVGNSRISGTLSASGSFSAPNASVSQTLSVKTVLASGQITTAALLADTINSSGAANIGGNLNVQGEAKSVVSGVEYFMVPKGGIILWSGATTNIPSGWRLCDGANGTPDLRDRFIVGAGATYLEGSTGGATSHSHGPGSYGVPAHSHSYSGTVTAPSANLPVLAGGAMQVATSGHRHDYSGTTAPGGGGSLTGSSAAADTLPPYYALAYIMRQ